MLDQNSSPHPRFLRLDSAAEKAALGKSTILAWEATGRFPRAVRLSATVRVWLESDVDQWIVAQHAKSTAAAALLGNNNAGAA